MIDRHLIVMPEQSFHSKDEVLEYLTHLDNDRVIDPDGYAKDVSEREETFATYIMDGIAIPHAKTAYVSDPFVVYAKLKEKVHWGTEEGEDADQVFLLGVPKNGKDNQFANLHLEILNRLSRQLMHDDFRASLAAASDIEEIYRLLKKTEED